MYGNLRAAWRMDLATNEDMVVPARVEGARGVGAHVPPMHVPGRVQGSEKLTIQSNMTQTRILSCLEPRPIAWRCLAGYLSLSRKLLRLRKS